MRHTSIVVLAACACSRSGLDVVDADLPEDAMPVDATADVLDAGTRDATEAEAAPGPTSCTEGVFVVVQDQGTPLTLDASITLDATDDIAVDDTYVYWHSAGGLYRAPKTGGKPKLLVGYSSETETPNPAAFVMDQTYLYYYPEDGIHRVNKDGSGNVLLASLPSKVPSNSGRVAFDSQGALLAWLGDFGTEIDRVPLDGGAPSKVESCGPPTQVASASSTLVRAYGFFTLTPGAWLDDIDGGTSQKISTNPAWNIASNGDVALLASNDLLSFPLDGGASSVLVPLSLAWGIAIDGSMVYFTDATGPVGKVPIDGGTWSLIADGPQTSGAIAVDDQCVYWAHTEYGGFNGAIFAAPK